MFTYLKYVSLQNFIIILNEIKRSRRLLYLKMYLSYLLLFQVCNRKKYKNNGKSSKFGDIKHGHRFGTSSDIGILFSIPYFSF